MAGLPNQVQMATGTGDRETIAWGWFGGPGQLSTGPPIDMKVVCRL